MYKRQAIDRGLRLNEFGLFPEKEAGGKIGIAAAKHTLECKNESEIYRILDMEFVPPELREDMGEIEAATEGVLPRLIEPEDLRGSLHNHTTASDGTASLGEMADGAMAMGWEYLGIADHSEFLNIGGRQIGVPADELLEQGREILSLIHI